MKIDSDNKVSLGENEQLSDDWKVADNNSID